MSRSSGRDSKSNRDEHGDDVPPDPSAESPVAILDGDGDPEPGGHHEGEQASDGVACDETETIDRLSRVAAGAGDRQSLGDALAVAVDAWVSPEGWQAGLALRRDGAVIAVAGVASAGEADAADWERALDESADALGGLLDVAHPRTLDASALPGSLARLAERSFFGCADVFPIRASGSVVGAIVLLRAEADTPPPAARSGVAVTCRLLDQIAARTRAQNAVAGAAKHIRALTEQAEPTRARLLDLEARYALLCRAAEPGLWDWDIQGERIHYSPRWKAALGYGANELTDAPSEWFDRIHTDDADRVELELLEHFDGQSPRFESEHRLLHADGSYRWVRVRGVAERREDGQPSRLAGSLIDVTESRSRDDRTAQDLMYHRLTGHPNAALLRDRIEQAMRRRSRRPDHAFAVLAVSLDGIREMSHRVGTEATEEILLTLARRMASAIRPGDTVAHTDELDFTVLLDDVKNLDDALRVTDRLIAGLRQELPLGSETITLVPGAGLALSRAAYETPEEMIRDAGIALRRARREEIPVQVFDAATRAFAQSINELEGDLRTAFEQRDLFLEYQPVVSLGDGRITGLEAYLRWTHPERGPIPPSEFLPVAREAGLLQELGYWVTERACRQMQEWIELFNLRFPPNIAINVDEAQLFDADFVTRTIEAIESTKIDFKLVRLDVSEGTFMKDGPAAGRVLRALTGRGVRVAVDDFGTGYSSLSYLHRYPIGALKIDRAFVSGTAGQSNEWDVARTIIELAKILELEVIAEGIETREQFQQLRKLGCQQAQGFYFSGPVAPSKAAKLIQEGYPLDLARPVG